MARSGTSQDKVAQQFNVFIVEKELNGTSRNLRMAERVGFEPTIRGYRIHAFQACAFSRSATSPAARK